MPSCLVKRRSQPIPNRFWRKGWESVQSVTSSITTYLREVRRKTKVSLAPSLPDVPSIWQLTWITDQIWLSPTKLVLLVWTGVTKDLPVTLGSRNLAENKTARPTTIQPYMDQHTPRWWWSHSMSDPDQDNTADTGILPMIHYVFKDVNQGTTIFMDEGSNTLLITTKLMSALYLEGKVKLTTVLKACDKVSQAVSHIHHEVELKDHQGKKYRINCIEVPFITKIQDLPNL